MKLFGKTFRQRFQEKYDTNGPTMPGMRTRCWVWTAANNGAGYGMIRNKAGRMKLAHRISYTNHNGKIQKNIQINHKCNNPSCVNPEHLYAGTHTDNMRDARKAGKSKGEKNSQSVLSQADVISIRHTYSTARIKHGLVGKLAQQYGVSSATISRIISGKTW